MSVAEKRAYQLGVLLPEELRAHYNHACTVERRSMSMQAVVLIEEWLRRKGYLPEETEWDTSEAEQGVDV